VGIAAVDYEVSLIENGSQRADRLIDGLSGGNQQQNGPRTVQHCSKLAHGPGSPYLSRAFFSLRDFPGFCRIHVVYGNRKPVVGEIQGQIATHRARPHHPYVAFMIRHARYLLKLSSTAEPQRTLSKAVERTGKDQEQELRRQ
jgi:hypothetical protein